LVVSVAVSLTGAALGDSATTGGNGSGVAGFIEVVSAVVVVVTDVVRAGSGSVGFTAVVMGSDFEASATIDVGLD
jgi:hypothetical protein